MVVSRSATPSQGSQLYFFLFWIYTPFLSYDTNIVSDFLFLVFSLYVCMYVCMYACMCIHVCLHKCM